MAHPTLCHALSLFAQVMPAERIRSVGDPIKDGDRVVLENFKFTKSYLAVSDGAKCCSSRLGRGISGIPPHPSIHQRLEVNAYAYPAIFRMRLFEPIEFCRHAQSSLIGVSHKRFGGSAEQAETSVLGCDFITLSHKHHDSVLVGNTEEGTVSWVPRRGLASEAPGGAEGDDAIEPTALWRLVKREAHLGGGPISRLGEQVVFAHVASGLYLTALPNGGVALTSYPGEEDCHWMILAKPKPSGGGLSASQGLIEDGDLLWIR